jgi:hypothetical protein
MAPEVKPPAEVVMLHWKNRIAFLLVSASALVAAFAACFDGFYW